MKIVLTTLEARVIGCLIEKQITTPDQYPLSLNALANACNQKSNRDPVMDLDEATVQQTVDALSKKHFVMEKSGFGSRVPKYQHRFCNTEFGTLKLDPQELAIVCELLVRGPQTPGELRTRASRMAPFAETSEVEAALSRLSQRQDGPFVVRLAREPNRRDSRWAHLFSGPVADAATGHEDDALRSAGHGATGYGAERSEAGQQGSLKSHAEGPSVSAPEISFPASRNDERLAKVEQEVSALRAELEDLKRRLGG
ncbi:MAG: YceH family protein [Steroidobacteraceae bacterium]